LKGTPARLGRGFYAARRGELLAGYWRDLLIIAVFRVAQAEAEQWLIDNNIRGWVMDEHGKAAIACRRGPENAPTGRFT
jgi:hypothetical protein